MAQRVTQAAQVVLTDGQGSIRVTQAAQVVLTNGQGAIRVSQAARVVLVQNTSPATNRQTADWQD